MIAKLTFCDCCGQEFYDIWHNQTCDNCLDLLNPNFQVLFENKDLNSDEVEIDWDNIPF